MNYEALKREAFAEAQRFLTQNIEDWSWNYGTGYYYPENLPNEIFQLAQELMSFANEPEKPDEDLLAQYINNDLLTNIIDGLNHFRESNLPLKFSHEMYFKSKQLSEELAKRFESFNFNKPTDRTDIKSKYKEYGIDDEDANFLANFSIMVSEIEKVVFASFKEKFSPEQQKTIAGFVIEEIIGRREDVKHIFLMLAKLGGNINK
ncbi:MAG: hypothetical protein Fur0024_4320 [Patescibacteria group bacterium]